MAPQMSPWEALQQVSEIVLHNQVMMPVGIGARSHEALQVLKAFIAEHEAEV